MSQCSINRCVFTLGTVLILSVSTFGATYYVDASATTNGPGTLDDYSNAFKNLQDAINWAGSHQNSSGNDIIHVAQGIYHPHATERNVSFTLPSDPTDDPNSGSGTIQILGGYAGLNAPIGVGPDERDIEAYPTILSGDLASDDVLGVSSTLDDNSFHVVKANGNAISVDNTIVDGVTITAGCTYDSAIPSEQDGGAGMWNSNGASPRLTNCIFTHNIAAYGGAIWNLDGSNPEVISCEFSLNGDDNTSGGGILNENGSNPTIRSCTFDRHLSDWGGGVMNWKQSSAVIVDCLFTNNHAATNGAGVFVNENSTANIINCKFYGNRAEHVGAGVELRQDDMAFGVTRVTNCVFVGNHAGESGGGMRAGRDTHCILTNCTFVANSCSYWVVPTNPPTTLYNTGGGFSIGADSCSQDTRTSQMFGCIFYGNFYVSPATGAGTQIAIVGLAPGSLEIHDCNVEDGGISGNGIYVIPQTGCGAGELSSDGAELYGDPQFVRMPDGGSDGFGDNLSTTSVDESANDDYGDLRLACGSPCINQGDAADLQPDVGDLDGNDETSEDTPLDLAMTTRVIGSDVDMGAYETQPVVTCVGDVASSPCPNCVVDVDDLLAVINSWGPCDDPDNCPADFVGTSNEVDVDDLLGVINNWGPCTGCLGDEAMPQSVDDCMDRCSDRHPGDEQAWVDCVDDCVTALCEAEIIECDE